MLGSIEVADWTSKEVIGGWGENFLRSDGAALTMTERVVSVAIDKCGVIGLDGARILGVTTRVDDVPGSEYWLAGNLSAICVSGLIDECKLRCGGIVQILSPSVSTRSLKMYREFGRRFFTS